MRRKWSESLRISRRHLFLQIRRDIILERCCCYHNSRPSTISPSKFVIIIAELRRWMTVPSRSRRRSVVRGSRFGKFLVIYDCASTTTGAASDAVAAQRVGTIVARCCERHHKREPPTGTPQNAESKWASKETMLLEAVPWVLHFDKILHFEASNSWLSWGLEVSRENN